MIVHVDWQTFSAIFMQQIVYVKENESNWELWTSQDLFHIKCTVEKEGDIRDVMFVERWLKDRKNIIKVIDFGEEEDEEEEVPMQSDEAIRDEELTEEEDVV